MRAARAKRKRSTFRRRNNYSKLILPVTPVDTGVMGKLLRKINLGKVLRKINLGQLFKGDV